jgi:outer membrane receptor protein involved in Fe transport
LVGSVRNLFNAAYSDPGADPLLDDIPQNGRTFRIGLEWKLGTK